MKRKGKDFADSSADKQRVRGDNPRHVPALSIETHDKTRFRYSFPFRRRYRHAIRFQITLEKMDQ